MKLHDYIRYLHEIEVEDMKDNPKGPDLECFPADMLVYSGPDKPYAEVGKDGWAKEVAEEPVVQRTPEA